jgi:hypothetical protein
MTTLRPPYAEIDDVEFGAADYVVHVRNGNYRAKNLHSLGNDFTGPTLHGVFNQAVTSLTNADQQTTGGHIHIASPDRAEAPMILTDSLVGATGITVTGDNQASVIRADPTFPVNKAMLDFRNCDRVHIQSLDLDCNNVAQIGIWQRRNTVAENPGVGGPKSANRIVFNRIRNWTGTTSGFGAGIVIGKDSTEQATANLMLMGNNLDGAKSVSVTNTLSAAITTTSATSLTVTSGAAFPSTDTTTLGPWASHFLIQIDSEWMLCTARSTNTLTVKRGMLGTTAATHLNAATVTAYFGSHGLRNFLGDLQANYNNWNNPGAKHGCGIYADCHTVVYTTHVAADALTSWADVYLCGGSNANITDSYLDTIQAGCGIYIMAPPGGSVANPIIRANYFNMQNSAATGAYGVLIDATNGNTGDAMITNNMAKGPTSGALPAAFLHGDNLTGQGTFVMSNLSRGTALFNDGSAPDFLKPNMLDNNSTKTIVGS